MSQTVRKKPKVFRDGFKYVVHKVNVTGTIQYWRCQQFRSCHGRAISEVGSFDIRPTQPHNHPPVEERSFEELELINMSENLGTSFRKRKKTHPIWNCFIEIEEDGKRKNKCIACDFSTEDSVHATLRSHVRKFHSAGPENLYSKLMLETGEYAKKKEVQHKSITLPSQVSLSHPVNPTEKLQYYLDSIDQKTISRLDRVINDVLENADKMVPTVNTANMNNLNSLSSSTVPNSSMNHSLNYSEESRFSAYTPKSKGSSTVTGSPSTSLAISVKEELDLHDKNIPFEKNNTIEENHNVFSEANNSPAKKKKKVSSGTGNPPSPFLMLPENLLNVFQEAASGKPTSIFSLSSTSSISDLLDVAKDLKLKFMFDAGCGSEYCLSRDGSSDMLVIVDAGNQVLVKTKNNNVVVEEVKWTKAEWDQFLWAVRGKCSKLFNMINVD